MKNDFRTVMQYVFPSIGSMLVVYLYVVVDGIFVGRGIGKDALAAVSLSAPSIVFITAIVGTMVAGGSTVTAIRLGRGDRRGANDAFMTSVCLTALVSAVAFAASIFLAELIALVSGSSARLFSMTSDYIRWYNVFTPLSAFAACISAFVRIDGNPQLSFWGMVVGAISNIFLDWLFVYPLQMGVRGAAIASGLGQGISLLLVSLHFVKNMGALRLCRFRPSGKLVVKVLQRGIPEFVTRLAPPITTLCYNLVVMRTMGELGVSAYAIIGYISQISVGIFVGVSSGVQPLIGRSFGQSGKKGAAYFYRVGMALNVLLSVGIYLILLAFGDRITAVFNSDQELISTAYSFIRTYSLSFVVASVNIILITYFMSTKGTWQALTLATLRGVILNSAIILAAPWILGECGIWSAITIAEGITAVVGLFLKNRSDKAIKF